MGLFGSSSVFDPLVDKATSEENTTENWNVIMEICDLVTEDQAGPKECMKSIYRRLSSNIPVVVMQSLALIDACISNCGKGFHLEVCSREFQRQFVNLLSSDEHHMKVVERSRQLLEKWANEFKNDPQLTLIPDLYKQLKSEGVDFSQTKPRKTASKDPALTNPDAVSSAQEEADVLKAIELSMKDISVDGSGGGGGSTQFSSSDNKMSTANSSSYPSLKLDVYSSNKSNNTTTNANNSTSNIQSQPAKDPIKVRALYDFEAAEDNELTFKAGEIVLVSDNSDVNWWKGSNHRGEGLFPSNFVTTELNDEPESPSKDRKVQFKEDVKVVGDQNKDTSQHSNGYSKVTEIDESRMDRLLYLLHEADPHSEKADSDELLALEMQCVAMIPIIDHDIESIDKEHADLSELNDKLNSALSVYHDLMKESMIISQKQTPAMPYTAYSAPGYGQVGLNGQFVHSQYDPSQHPANVQQQFDPQSQQQYQPQQQQFQQPPLPVEMYYASSKPQQQQPQQQAPQYPVQTTATAASGALQASQSQAPPQPQQPSQLPPPQSQAVVYQQTNGYAPSSSAQIPNGSSLQASHQQPQQSQQAPMPSASTPGAPLEGSVINLL